LLKNGGNLKDADIDFRAGLWYSLLYMDNVFLQRSVGNGKLCFTTYAAEGYSFTVCSENKVFADKYETVVL